MKFLPMSIRLKVSEVLDVPRNIWVKTYLAPWMNSVPGSSNAERSHTMAL